MEQKNLKDIGDSFIIHHHLGLGDSIICNGLVNYLSKKNNKVYLPVKSNLLDKINYLYSDNNDVEIFEIDNESREQDILYFAEKKSVKILRIGFDNIGATSFNLAFYKQIGLPYRYTYKYFNLPEAVDKELELQNHLIDYYNVDPKNYSIVHNEYQWPGGTFELKNTDEKNTIFVTRESDIFNNIFYYQKLIQDANTIHCINSSFLHLVERVKTSAKLYYHHLRKNKMHLSNRWTYVDYEN